MEGNRVGRRGMNKGRGLWWYRKVFRLGSYIAVLEERVQESVSGSEEGGAERE